MFRKMLLFAFVIVIASLLLNLMLLGSYSMQTGRVRSLEGAVSSLRDEIAALEGKHEITCSDPVLKSSSGRPYARISAMAGKDGNVTLELENLHDDPVFAINIREVLVGYDKKQGRIAADYRTSPTFKEVGSNSTCSGIIDPGDSMTCESASFSDVIARTLVDGDDTFMIKHLSLELDLRPYYFVASDICVTIA